MSVLFSRANADVKQNNTEPLISTNLPSYCVSSQSVIASSDLLRSNFIFLLPFFVRLSVVYRFVTFKPSGKDLCDLWQIRTVKLLVGSDTVRADQPCKAREHNRLQSSRPVLLNVFLIACIRIISFFLLPFKVKPLHHGPLPLFTDSSCFL